MVCCAAVRGCFADAARELRFAPVSEEVEVPELLAEGRVRLKSLGTYAPEVQAPAEEEDEVVVLALVVAAEVAEVPVVAVYIGPAVPWRTPLGGLRQGQLAMISKTYVSDLDTSRMTPSWTCYPPPMPLSSVPDNDDRPSLPTSHADQPGRPYP